ncbi:MAG: hypothetical protein CSA25_04345 [Desulfobacter postgatei]|uniref:DUF1007 family protein n=1 Tax=Desulfobacter postgatei TaxID=2293 RepID=A0A2G6MR67_9BACT|nr:MAG: hypothetical protein CSA25_04345 [Desulfobacter postgatei]
MPEFCYLKRERLEIHLPHPNWHFRLLLVTLIVLIPLPGRPHPHVFISQRTDFVFDDKGLAGFRVHWTFDEMFSVMISEDFDSDHNQTLDAREVAVIKEKAFGYIAPYNYYIHVRIDGRPFQVKFIKEFNAWLDHDTVCYEFFIPCHVSAINTPKQIVLSPYDPEYYSDIYFPDNAPLRMENDDAFTIKVQTARDKSTLIYYDTVNPMAIFLWFQRK